MLLVTGWKYAKEACKCTRRLTDMQNQTPITICKPQQHQHTTSQASPQQHQPNHHICSQQLGHCLLPPWGSNTNAIHPPLTTCMHVCPQPQLPLVPAPNTLPFHEWPQCVCCNKTPRSNLKPNPATCQDACQPCPSTTYPPPHPQQLNCSASTAACDPTYTSKTLEIPQPTGQIPPLHTPPRQYSSPRTLAPFQGQHRLNKPCPVPPPSHTTWQKHRLQQASKLHHCEPT